MIPVVPVLARETLLARLDQTLDALPSPERAVIATDGDGTLWTSDVGEALFAELLERRMIGESARVDLLAEAREHGVSVPEDDPTAIARALFEAYSARRFPEDRICAAMAWCVAGHSVAAIDEVAREVLEGSFGLRDRLIEEAGAVLQWAHRRRLSIVLVSASPRVVVERAAKIMAERWSLPVPRILAMTPRVSAGIIQSQPLQGTWTYGEGKTLALTHELAGEASGVKRSIVAAMGDNVFDAPMLRAACVPIAVRPKPALSAIAAEIPGLVRAS